MSEILRMSYGSGFQAVWPATENARSPSLVLVGGTNMTACLWMSADSVARDEAAV